MVSALTVAAIAFSMLVSLAAPVAMAIYYGKRHKISFLSVLIGGAVFIVFALIFEGIVNYLILKVIPVTVELFKNPWAYGVYGGLAAGVFEEGGRFIAFMLILKKFRGWQDGVAYGIGHGGVEAIYLGVLGNLNNFIYSVFINLGLYDKLILKPVADYSPAAVQQYESVRVALINTNPMIFTVSGVERLMSFAIQIALSLLLLYGIRNRRYIFLLYAVLLHAAVDFPAGLYQQHILNLWVTEGIILVAAALSVVFIIKSKKLFERPVPPPKVIAG
jgi:uncharacterized membrane protein YhfC